jgi:hypothetical protein
LSSARGQANIVEQVVDEHSARLHFPGEEALPMEYNHREMCKIKSMESQHWRSLSGAIKRQVENLGLELKYIEMSSKGVAQSRMYVNIDRYSSI